jgi:hypothetical protein
LVLWLQAKFGGAGGGIGSKNGRGVRAAVAAETAPSAIPGDAVKEGTKEYDAIVIGSGIGGLVAATQPAIRGADSRLLCFQVSRRLQRFVRWAPPKLIAGIWPGTMALMGTSQLASRRDCWACLSTPRQWMACIVWETVASQVKVSLLLPSLARCVLIVLPPILVLKRGMLSYTRG